MAHEGQLRPIKRFITAHRADGRAVFSTQLAEESTMKPLPDNMAFALSYTTNSFPVDMAEDKDVSAYSGYLNNPPGLTIPGGTVLRHVDFVPGVTCAMHRTVSLDYGICLEGEIECILDSGETKTLKRGDVCIQRGTMHAWRNPSDKEWSRMVFVLQPCKPVIVKGQELGEELGTAVGIRKSDKGANGWDLLGGRAELGEREST